MEIRKQKFDIVLGCSGSVACIRVPDIIEQLQSQIHLPGQRLCITLVPTIPAERILNTIRKPISGTYSASSFEIREGQYIDPNTPLSAAAAASLANDADLLLVAPAGANFLSTLVDIDVVGNSSSSARSNLTRVVAEYLKNETKSRPILLAPAMNPFMWNSRITESVLHSLLVPKGRFVVIPPVSKRVMCGETGYGGMESVENIVKEIRALLDGSTDLFSLHGRLNSTFSLPGFTDAEDSAMSIQAESVAQLFLDSSPEPLFGTVENPKVLLCILPDADDQQSARRRKEWEKHLKYHKTNLKEIKTGPSWSSTTDAMGFVAENIGTSDLETITCFTDDMEWKSWRKREDPILHIWLRHWADAFIIVNPSVRFLKDVEIGLCFDLLTCVIRAWDFAKPIYFVVDDNTDNESRELFFHLNQLGFRVIRILSEC